MLGIRYVKVPPTTWVMQFQDGDVRREGPGLAFFCFGPRSTIVAVPMGSTDVPFMFQHSTADWQAVTVQGHLTYRIAYPRKLAAVLDFSWKGDRYLTDDPVKVPQRIAQAVEAATRSEVRARSLRASVADADAIAAAVRAAVAASPALVAMGVEVLSLSILAVRPLPDTQRALEAEARERLLREADDAVYGRRNNAVEQERRIRENELSTEVAVQARQREIEEARLATAIALEESRRELVQAETENVRARAEASAYAAEAALAPLRATDPRALQVLAVSSADPRALVALAFQEIAANAAKVGNLNISPDLLDRLLQPRE
jgi:hypothetical protein